MNPMTILLILFHSPVRLVLIRLSNSREYWSSVASIVSSRISRNSYSFLHVDPDLISDLDLNSSASDLLRGCVGAFPPFTSSENSVLPIQTASARGDMSLDR